MDKNHGKFLPELVLLRQIRHRFKKCGPSKIKNIQINENILSIKEDSKEACDMCLATPKNTNLNRLIKKSLYLRYSFTDNFAQAQPVNQILLGTICKTLLRYRETVLFLNEEQYLKRFYEWREFREKFIYLWKFHQFNLNQPKFYAGKLALVQNSYYKLLLRRQERGIRKMLHLLTDSQLENNSLNIEQFIAMKDNVLEGLLKKRNSKCFLKDLPKNIVHEKNCDIKQQEFHRINLSSINKRKSYQDSTSCIRFYENATNEIDIIEANLSGRAKTRDSRMRLDNNIKCANSNEQLFRKKKLFDAKHCLPREVSESVIKTLSFNKTASKCNNRNKSKETKGGVMTSDTDKIKSKTRLPTSASLKMNNKYAIDIKKVHTEGNKRSRLITKNGKSLSADKNNNLKVTKYTISSRNEQYITSSARSKPKVHSKGLKVKKNDELVSIAGVLNPQGVIHSTNIINIIKSQQNIPKIKKQNVTQTMTRNSNIIIKTLKLKAKSEECVKKKSKSILSSAIKKQPISKNINKTQNKSAFQPSKNMSKTNDNKTKKKRLLNNSRQPMSSRSSMYASSRYIAINKYDNTFMSKSFKNNVVVQTREKHTKGKKGDFDMLLKNYILKTEQITGSINRMALTGRGNVN